MFCSSCGQEIPEKSAYCLSCGKAIGKKKEKDTAAIKFVKVLIGLVLVIGAWLFVVGGINHSRSYRHSSTASSSVLRPFTQNLYAGTVEVAPGIVHYRRFSINNTFVTPRVVGEFRASGGSGNDIQAVVASWPDCENWMNGHKAHAVYSTERITNARIDVPITEPGDYCVAFSNAFSLVSTNRVRADIGLEYLTR